MAQLSFVATYTVAEFKELHNVVKIDIIKNPTTSKLFFVANTGIGTTLRGAVSMDYKENTSISKVVGSNNEEFYLIHKRGSVENIAESL